MDEIKSLSFHVIFYRLYRGVANTLFPVIPFHHLSDCDLYTPPTTGREGETDAGGDENDQLGHNQELVPKGRTTWSCVFKHCSFKTTGSLVENRNKYFHAFLTLQMENIPVKCKLCI